MQISSANLLAAQQAAQAALVAKQAARTAPAAPAFTLPDLEAGSLKPTAEAAKPAAAPAQASAPQPGSRLGQHINIVI